MEHVNGLHLLARTYKLDRFGDHSAYGESCTTTGIAVKFGQHHAVEVQTIVELLGCVDSILTRHGVNHEQCLVRTDRLLQGCYLVHHLLVNSQTACGIDDDHIIVLGLCLANSVVGNLNHILVVWLRVDGYAHTLAHHVELLDSSRTIDVTGHQ